MNTVLEQMGVPARIDLKANTGYPSADTTSHFESTSRSRLFKVKAISAGRLPAGSSELVKSLIRTALKCRLAICTTRLAALCQRSSHQGSSRKMRKAWATLHQTLGTDLNRMLDVTRVDAGNPAGAGHGVESIICVCCSFLRLKLGYRGRCDTKQ